MPTTPGITHMVNAAFAGDDEAVAEVWGALYDEIHSIARRIVGTKWSGDWNATLQPTAVVHEVFLRMNAAAPMHWDSRAHFFGACGRAMEQLLVDHHRARQRIKRGGGQRRLTLAHAEGLATPLSDHDDRDADLEVRLIEAIKALESHSPRLADVARMRWVVGLTAAQVGEVLEVTDRTVRKDTTYARAWLASHLERTSGNTERE